MSGLKKSLPYVVLALGLLVVAMTYSKNAKINAPAGAADLDFNALAHTVVMDEGRVKPLDTVARNVLLVLYGKQAFKHEGQRVDAIAWLADAMARPQVADQYKVFRIDHPDVITTAGLSQAEGEDGKYFSYAQLLPARRDVFMSGRAASQKDSKDQTPYEKATLKLGTQLGLYEQLSLSYRPLPIPPMTEEAQWSAYAEWPRAIAQSPGPQADIFAVWSVVRIVRDQQLALEQVEPFFRNEVQNGQLPPGTYQFAVLYVAYLGGPEL